MKLGKYYIIASLYSAITVLILSIVYSVIENREYKSEWFTANTVIMISIVFSLVVSAIICTLSLTIFLNEFNIVKKNIVLSFLSWFLLPVGFMTIFLVHSIKMRIQYGPENDTGLIHLIIIIIPYLVGLTVSFLRFRLRIK